MADKVVLTAADAGIKQFVKVGGECFERVGATDQAATHVVAQVQGTYVDCAACDASLPAPATCPACVAAFYRLADLSGLSTAGCTTCQTGTGTAWNGKLGSGPILGVWGACTWPIYTADSGGILGGKVLLPGSSGVGLSGANWM